MIFVILNESARKGELLLVDGGMLRFTIKQNGDITLNEIIVLPSHRRKGIGQSLIQRVIDDYPCSELSGHVPIAYIEANAMYVKLEFTLLRKEKARTGTVMNTWVLPPREEKVQITTQSKFVMKGRGLRRI